MTIVSGREVFSCDYNDLEAVKALAKKFGKGMAIIKYVGRENYNITHVSSLTDDRVTRWGKYEEVYRT